MARDKNKPKTINVKSAETGDSGVINLVELSKRVNEDTCTLDMSENMSNTSSEDLKLDIRSLGSSVSLTTVDSEDDFMFAIRDITPCPGELQKKINDDCIPIIRIEEPVVDLQVMPASNTMEICEPNLIVAETSKETTTKKKRKNKKKNRTNNNKPTIDPKSTEKPEVESEKNQKDSASEVKSPERLAPIVEEVESTEPGRAKTEEERAVQMKKAGCFGCFGFNSRWWIKRKEKKRAKKRAAIEARKAKSAEKLVVYDNRASRGGISFTIQMDSRPMSKPVLPPIRKRPGPIRMARDLEKKQEIAETIRAYHLAKKREAARAHSKLVRETAVRKAQIEEDFKQATLDKVLDKSNRAFSRLQNTRQKQRYHSKCASRMESCQQNNVEYDSFWDD